MKGDALYLIHISECIERIESYVDVRDRQAFMASTLIQDAVLRNLQVLCESTQQLSESMKAAHPEIEWRQIAGLRNVLVHNYLGVDLERVWLLLSQDLPALKRVIVAMREELGP
jgi:uncharacterized protein with HEPN domain